MLELRPLRQLPYVCADSGYTVRADRHVNAHCIFAIMANKASARTPWMHAQVNGRVGGRYCTHQRKIACAFLSSLLVSHRTSFEFIFLALATSEARCASVDFTLFCTVVMYFCSAHRTTHKRKKSSDASQYDGRVKLLTSTWKSRQARDTTLSECQYLQQAARYSSKSGGFGGQFNCIRG